LRLRIIVAAIAAAALAIPASAPAAKGGKSEATVMSRNIYLGANLDPVLAAPDIPSAVAGAGQIYNEIERTNFPERAVLLGDEIKDAKADIVGLQEVALWQEQMPSDGGGPPITGGSAATTVKYDFLDLIMDQLGPKYRVVGVQQEFQGELPADADGDGNAERDLRLTMNDVVVARKGTKTKRVRSGNYETRFETSISGIPVAADRGWVSTQAQVGKAKFRFVNTHLEAFGDPSIRAAQAKELVKGPAKSKKDVVLVGDMNSAPSDPADERAAYDTIRKAGFVERQVKGNTSGHEEVLNNPNDQANFRRKIDFVFVNNKEIKLDRGDSAIVGRDDPARRTPSGLWPSDHAGVVSSLLFP
jgi:endonuclease/exonuclease/phosphatase family metal-dependent hydrolase